MTCAEASDACQRGFGERWLSSPEMRCSNSGLLKCWQRLTCPADSSVKSLKRLPRHGHVDGLIGDRSKTWKPSASGPYGRQPLWNTFTPLQDRRAHYLKPGSGAVAWLPGLRCSACANFGRAIAWLSIVDDVLDAHQFLRSIGKTAEKYYCFKKANVPIDLWD